jgi:putative ABC transport system permease protein
MCEVRRNRSSAEHKRRADRRHVGAAVKYLPLIWSGIWRNPGRAMLILLQVLIAFLLFGLLQGFKSGIDQVIAETRAEILVVHSRQSLNQPIPLAYFGRIQAVPGVKAVFVQNFLVGSYQKPTQFIFADAIDPDPKWARYPGLKISEADIKALGRTRNGALVSEELARKYSWKVGDRIPLNTALAQENGSTDWSFDILGTFMETERLGLSEAILINNDYLNEARVQQKNTVHHFIVLADDPKQLVAVAQAVDDLFANSQDETRTEPLREMAQSQFQSLGDINFIVRSVVGAVFFALLFSVGAMMMQSLRERSPELAVLKALGFSDTKIFWVILVEALVLCVAAALLGLMCAAEIFPLAKPFLGGIAMPYTVVAVGAGLAVVLALISAAMPAWRGMRLQVVEALGGR